MASVDPPYLRFRMFYFFTKRIICEDPPAMRDLFDEDHIIFLAGLSLSGCYIRIQRTFSLLIKKLVRGPMDELQADYEDYIRSRSQHPVEFQNVTNKVKEHILDQMPTPMPSPLAPLRDADSITATPAGSPAVPQGAEDRASA
ncbi:hypothetical protein FOXYS1_3378 [Fusarium oxysporum]|uniref:Uncharacterized protein n=1 Tax=Fusarium oxysporum TaxID=5507 RepID=A0A8H5AIT5_FUSOX|nr:hypothetical protein FOXYS1_3378 [Fusarium oxysporum]